MTKKDVQNRTDIKTIIEDFYTTMLNDMIVGFIFTDVAKINLESHLPIIVNFWQDVLFKTSSQPRHYRGNALQVHLDLNKKMPLTPGHFTRWLFLFNSAVDKHASGPNAELMKKRAELVAKSISATISDQKKGNMNLVLPK